VRELAVEILDEVEGDSILTFGAFAKDPKRCWAVPAPFTGDEGGDMACAGR
jgi:hypothetical protein